jgi:hypothetical protein
MSSTIDRVRDELVKAKVLRRRRDRDTVDMAEAIRHGSPLPRNIEPEKPLPDVPLHKRGLGVRNEDCHERTGTAGRGGDRRGAGLPAGDGAGDDGE